MNAYIDTIRNIYTGFPSILRLQPTQLLGSTSDRYQANGVSAGTISARRRPAKSVDFARWSEVFHTSSATSNPRKHSGRGLTDIHPTLTPSAGYRSDVISSNFVCCVMSVVTDAGPISIRRSRHGLDISLTSTRVIV